ncbi:hypothetical protein G9A89_008562 [Geosiphon pyriformis]|nr:hypothetical protein G9A89_008562 [Geosiphon pyriformis]
MTYIGRFNKLFRQICQLETNNYYSDAQILDQFIAGLKDKLIKKICSYAPKDLNSAIQHVKRYKMAIEKANCTKLKPAQQLKKKLTNLQKRLKTISPINNNSNPKDINHPKDEIKITLHHFLITSLRIAITLQQDQQNRSNQRYPPPQPSYYQPPSPAYYPPRPQYPSNYYQPAPQPIQQQYQQPFTQHYQNFHHTVLSEGRAATQQQNLSYTPTTIPPARIAENANLSDIFSFKFEANELPFLLSNAAANEQKAITAMYTEAEVKKKSIHLILNIGSTESIITYQLIQQLKRNVDQPAQTIIVTANDMKKTPVGEIDNFLFTIDGITIPVKVLVIDAPQYQALVGNDWLQKANAKLDWKTQELQISYQGQHARVLATCGTFNKHSEKALAFEFKPEEKKPIIEIFMALRSTSNWADKTEQEHFTPHSEPKTPGWNISYSKPEPRKQCPYIPLKCKDCHKKLSSMGACISSEEEYENHTCYYCKACHREQWDYLIKRSGKWDNTSCLTCEDMLPEECNWIDIAMRRGVCDQTCQYVLSISEKVKRETPFNAVYNSALNKLYYYPHDAEMIFDLAMALINRATKKNVCQIKEAEYIEYTMELAGFDYEDEVEVYHQIASHTYPIQEAQIQQLEQMNIRLCEECIMPCDEHKNDENEIEFGEPEATEESETTLIYLIENQPALQLKYFNNNGQGIKPKKAHEIDAGYDLRYPDKDTFVLKPKSLTKINLKIALKIPPGAMVQITSRSSLASKRINVRGRIIDARYTGDITVMLQNETDKPFKIKHAEKIAQAIYLPLINISDLQLVN